MFGNTPGLTYRSASTTAPSALRIGTTLIVVFGFSADPGWARRRRAAVGGDLVQPLRPDALSGAARRAQWDIGNRES
jgi:hypothetical protein